MAMMRRTLRRAKCYVCLVIIVGQTRPSAYASFLGFQNNTYLYRWTDLNRMTSVSLWLLLFFVFILCGIKEPMKTNLNYMWWLILTFQVLASLSSVSCLHVLTPSLPCHMLILILFHCLLMLYVMCHVNHLSNLIKAT